MRCIVVDDELKAREVLVSLIEEHMPEVHVVAQASNISEAEILLNKHRIDFLFLDVEMPGGTGFDLLNNLKNIDFEVIFTTAYDQYAIKAIKFSAIDYLMKPLRVEELKDAINRVQEKINNAKILSQDSLKALLENVQPKNKKKIAISEGKGMVILNTDQIVRCEADKNYTNIFLQNGQKIMSSKNLKEYEDMLRDEPFFRVHQSHLINLNYIEKVTKEDGAYLVLKDGSQIEVSRRRKSELMHVLMNM